MTALILISLLVLTLAAAAVRVASHDGRGSLRPPASHADDPLFRSPLAR